MRFVLLPSTKSRNSPERSYSAGLNYLQNTRVVVSCDQVDNVTASILHAHAHTKEIYLLDIAVMQDSIIVIRYCSLIELANRCFNEGLFL